MDEDCLLAERRAAVVRTTPRPTPALVAAMPTESNTASFSGSVRLFHLYL